MRSGWGYAEEKNNKTGTRTEAPHISGGLVVRLHCQCLRHSTLRQALRPSGSPALQHNSLTILKVVPFEKNNLEVIFFFSFRLVYAFLCCAKAFKFH